MLLLQGGYWIFNGQMLCCYHRYRVATRIFNGQMLCCYYTVITRIFNGQMLCCYYRVATGYLMVKCYVAMATG